MGNKHWHPWESESSFLTFPFVGVVVNWLCFICWGDAGVSTVVPQSGRSGCVSAAVQRNLKERQVQWRGYSGLFWLSFATLASFTNFHGPFYCDVCPQMMADIMYRKQDYEQVVLHFEQLLEHKPGALELHLLFSHLSAVILNTYSPSRVAFRQLPDAVTSHWPAETCWETGGNSKISWYGWKTFIQSQIWPRVQLLQRTLSLVSEEVIPHGGQMVAQLYGIRCVIAPQVHWKTQRSPAAL